MPATAHIIRLLAAAALIAASGPARAAPLAREACDAVKSEQDTLAAAGVRDDMAKGAEWAKANLPRERLAQVRRFIELEEQLLFRCGLVKARSTLPAEEETPPPEPAPAAKPKPKPKPQAKTPAPGDPAAAKAPAKTAAPGEPAAAKVSQPKAAPPANAATPAAAAPGEPAASKPKPKPKPKVDDAYRAPAPATPAAAQPAPVR